MHLKINGPKKYFWQWDTDRQLIVDDDACGEVHFCNGTTECALVCEIYEQDGQRMANVPNILLQSSNALTAYLYLKGSDGSMTRHQQSFPVVARTKPDDYIYTETEVKAWEALDERVRALEENGGGDAVQYTEQTLTEEQQMQARKNMGLYYSEEVPAEGELVYEYLYVGWWECFGVDTLAQNGCGEGVTYLIEVGGTTYECKPAFMDGYVGGGVRMYNVYLGNFGLYDREGEKSNAACPVCFNYYSDDGVVNDFDVAIDPNYKPSMGECISVRIATDEIVTKYDTIPDEYIPDSIARTSAIPTYTSQLENDSGFITADDIPSGGGITEESDPTVQGWAKTDIPATVGQYFRVSEVDENGNVTAVEAVDAPSGGGETWEKLNEFTLEENALTVEFSADADGNPFSLKKMRVFMYLPQIQNTSGENSHTGYTTYLINGVKPFAYSYPSSDWSNGCFTWTIEAFDKYMRVEVVKSGNWTWDAGNHSVFHSKISKLDTYNGTITSFLWTIFEPNADKPSAMAGATFEVWGVRA